jgi:hypothetical protein
MTPHFIEPYKLAIWAKLAIVFNFFIQLAFEFDNLDFTSTNVLTHYTLTTLLL